MKLVKEVVSEMGLDAELYSGHSFRIGAATTAAQAGITEATIKAYWVTSPVQHFYCMFEHQGVVWLNCCRRLLMCDPSCLLLVHRHL